MGKLGDIFNTEREIRCARAEQAPEPKEIALSAALTCELMRAAAGVHAILDSLVPVREVGDFTQYTAVVRLSRQVTRAEFEQALCRGLSRPVPHSD